MGFCGEIEGAWWSAGGRGLFFLLVIAAAGYLLLRLKRKEQPSVQADQGFKIVQRVQVAPRSWLILVECRQRVSLVGLSDGGFSVLDRQPGRHGVALASEEPGTKS